MEAVFLQVLNMSLTASYVILAVLLVRLLLRRAPKKYSYALWSVVAFRLCCPVSFRAAFSLLGLLRLERAAAEPAMAYIPQNIGMMARPEITVGIPAADAALSASLPAAEPMTSANPMQIWIFAGTILWCAGMAAMLLYAVISYARLHHWLKTAVWMERNVWQSERVCSPFILGVFRPRIYIPFGLSDETKSYVLAHERFHLRRLDHIVRPFAFLLLTVHWFNPLCHLAFARMTRDMEMRCDEQVLSGGEDRSRPYSLSLLAFASNRRLPSPGPLAFGESGVKARIRNILNWKQPKRWVTVLAAILCIAVLAACAANPVAESEPPLKDGDPTASFFFSDLEPGETVWLVDPVELTEESSDVAFQISYEQMGLTVDIGLVAEDGTTYSASVTGDSANQAIEGLPAGIYEVFVCNSEANLQYAETATEPLTVTGAIALTWPGLEKTTDGTVRQDPDED